MASRTRAPVHRVAGSLDEILDALRASTAFDMTVDPAAHHDLLDHGLQTAARLRASHPDDLDLQVAGLVHDIGHVLPPADTALHGDIAADFVGAVLGPRVSELVRLHVPAKRYLVAVEPGYRDSLNDGSTLSLEMQGDAMYPDDVAVFEADPAHVGGVVLRRADEAAKVHGLEVDGLDAWVPVVEAVMGTAGSARA